MRAGSHFEQMKGRGARTILDRGFQVVTPDATTKDRVALAAAEYQQLVPSKRQRVMDIGWGGRSHISSKQDSRSGREGRT